MSEKLKKCAKCRERAVASVTGHYETDLEHDGRKYAIVLPDLTYFQCSNCRNIFLPDESEERLTNELRKKAGLLEPATIVAHRKALDYKQQQLADWLGVAEATLCRWERGTQLPARIMDKLLRLFFESQAFRELWTQPLKTQCTVEITAASATTLPVNFANFGESFSKAGKTPLRGCNGDSLRNMANGQQAGAWVA